MSCHIIAFKRGLCLAILGRTVWSSRTSCSWTYHRNFHRFNCCVFKDKLPSLEDSSLLLKLSNDPDIKELREKYIDLAKIYHPDSGSAKADSGRFLEIQEAYKVVYTHLRGQYLDETEADEDSFSDHIAPQHRHYLNFGGFGFGPPSQRERAYRKHRAHKAFEKVSDHRLKQSSESSSDGLGLTTKERRSVKRNKSTNAIERMVEDLIQESMAKGDFDNLPRKGQPLPSKTQYCPFMDINQHNLNQVLVNNGVVPEFVALAKEIRHLLTESKSKLYKERVKLGLEPMNSFNQKKWRGLLQTFSDEINTINKKVAHFNLVVPLLRLQKVQICPEKEAQKVIDRYEENKDVVLEPKTFQEDNRLNNQINTLYARFFDQMAGKVIGRFFQQTAEKER